MNGMYYEENGKKIMRLGLDLRRILIGTRRDIKEITSLIRVALDLGINYIDITSLEECEHISEILLDVLSGYSRRNLFLTLEYKDLRKEERSCCENCFDDINVKFYLKDFLNKSHLEYIDLYRLECESEEFLEEIIEQAYELIEDGYVKYISISNYNFSKVISYSMKSKLSFITMKFTNDININEMLSSIRSPKVGIVVNVDLGTFNYNSTNFRQVLEELAEISVMKKVSMSQLLIARMLYKGVNIIPIISVRSIEELRDMVKCIELNFQKEELIKIDSILNKLEGVCSIEEKS